MHIDQLSQKANFQAVAIQCVNINVNDWSNEGDNREKGGEMEEVKICSLFLHYLQSDAC